MKKMLFCILLFPLLSLSEVDGGHNPHLGALIFEADIELINFSTQHEKKFAEALRLIKEVISSPEFKKRVLDFKYDNRRQYAQNGGLSNEYVYLKIIEAEEELFPSVNFQMDMEIELWKPRFPTSTIGYTNRDVRRIWIKKSFYENASIQDLAGNIFHEWLHKIGFEHDLRPTARRPYTVPYAIGDLLSELGKKMFKYHKKAVIQCFHKHDIHHSRR